MNSHYICQECKKTFTNSGNMDFQNTAYVCPDCGSGNVKKRGLLDFFKFICSGGG